MQPTPTIIRYPIPGNDDGGLLHIYGSQNASNVILYCGGWPDSVQPFTPMAQRLAASTKSDSGTGTDNDDGCFVGITCWPGFDYELYRHQSRGYKPEGYSFDEVTRCLREAASQLFAEYNKNKSNSDDDDSKSSNLRKKPQFTVIFHDFGVVTGLMFVNRAIEEKFFTQHKPNRVVLLDVLMNPHQKFDREVTRDITSYTNRETLVYSAYRGTFACTFAISQYLGSTIAIFMFGIMSSFIKILGLMPTKWIDLRLLLERKMNLRHMVYTFYPYYNLINALVFDHQELASCTLPLNLNETPVLYIYGQLKNVMFHDHRSLAILEREEREGGSDCKVVMLEEAGHHMFCQRPDECEREIRGFLKGGDITNSKENTVQLHSKLEKAAPQISKATTESDCSGDINGFDYELYSHQSRGYKPQGYSFDEVTCCLQEAASQLFAEYNKSKLNAYGEDNNSSNPEKKPQFTVIFHDFGVGGLIFVNRAIEEKYFTEHKPDRVVLLDVMMNPHRKFDRAVTKDIISYTNREILVHATYRGTFACTYAISRNFGSAIAVFIIWHHILILTRESI